MFGLNIRKVFPTVREHWCRLPGDLTDTYPRASLGSTQKGTGNQSSLLQTHCSATDQAIFLLPYFCKISFSFTTNVTELFCLESKGCQVPLAVSIVSCFPSPSCVFPEAAAPMDLPCSSGLTAACPWFAPRQEPAQRGWRGAATHTAPQLVQSPARSNALWGGHRQKLPGGFLSKAPALCLPLLALHLQH